MKIFNGGKGKSMFVAGKGCVILCLYFCLIGSIYGQEKYAVQIKTFDQSLAPYPNLEVSVNNGAYVSVNNKGIAFTEFNDRDLPVKNIQIKDDQLEAASWNYAKGTLEILVRKKNYRLMPILLKNDNNEPIPNLKLTFKGKTIVTATSDAKGHVQIPLALNDAITSVEQFAAEGYAMTSFITSRGEHVLTISPLQATVAAKPASSDFDLSVLDTIQSLPVFYSTIKKYDLTKLTQVDQQRVDSKFNELFAKLEQRIGSSSIGITVLGVSDSTSLADDINNLIRQAKLENQLLNAQRSEFDKKVFLINRKLENGIVSLNEEERNDLLDQLTLLEDVMIEYESQFFKNQNDYRTLINDIKDHFFEFQDLEEKLTISERQRMEAERLYKQRLLAISALVIVFALLIVVLIYFGYALRKQKKALQRANDEVKRINENLEVLIFNRTQSLQSAISELDTFLYKASHDLRGPVSSILGLCHLAEKAADGEREEVIDRIVGTSNEMDQLLRKLSIISEINRPRNLVAVSMLQLIAKVKESFQQLEDEKQIELRIRCPEHLNFHTYPHLVEAILFNLLENALYFSRFTKGSLAAVELSVELRGNMMAIVILDNGSGIDETVRSRIYDMFFKGSEISRGHGLGLYIVQKAVQAMDGKIAMESVPNQFTKFTVVLPLKSKEEINKEKTLQAILTAPI